MMMHDIVFLVLMFIGGLVLGALYFSGLWFTVLRIRHGNHPVLWLLTSLAVRMVLLLTAFYFTLSYGHWTHLLAVLAGFVVLRMVSTRRMRAQLSAAPSAAAIVKEKQL